MPNQLGPDSRRVNFIDSKDRHAALVRKAKERGTTFGQLVREALYEAYGLGDRPPTPKRTRSQPSKRRQRKPHSHGSPKAPAPADPSATPSAKPPKIDAAEAAADETLREAFRRAARMAKLAEAGQSGDAAASPAAPAPAPQSSAAPAPVLTISCTGVSITQQDGKFVVELRGASPISEQPSAGETNQPPIDAAENGPSLPQSGE